MLVGCCAESVGSLCSAWCYPVDVRQTETKSNHLLAFLPQNVLTSSGRVQQNTPTCSALAQCRAAARTGEFALRKWVQHSATGAMVQGERRLSIAKLRVAPSALVLQLAMSGGTGESQPESNKPMDSLYKPRPPSKTSNSWGVEEGQPQQDRNWRVQLPKDMARYRDLEPFMIVLEDALLDETRGRAAPTGVSCVAAMNHLKRVWGFKKKSSKNDAVQLEERYRKLFLYFLDRTEYTIEKLRLKHLSVLLNALISQVRSLSCSLSLSYPAVCFFLQVILSSSFAHFLPLSFPPSLPPTIPSPRPSHLSLRPLHPKKKQRWIDADRRNRIRAKCESAVKIILLEITAATDGAVVCVYV